MSKNPEIILEGSYLYFKKDHNYSQENFKLIHTPETQSYQIYAEILSRIETGEFLKILVKYEMNQSYLPTSVRIEKSIGNKYAMENYKVDNANQDLLYTFQTSQGIQEFKRPFNAKHYLTSPAVSTSAIFTLTKKFDASTRTPVVLISSSNDWTYVSPPTDKTIYAEFKTREMSEFKLNGTTLSASHLELFEFDSDNASSDGRVDLYLSKHFAIPYQLEQGDQKIVVKNLKKNL